MQPQRAINDFADIEGLPELPLNGDGRADLRHNPDAPTVSSRYGKSIDTVFSSDFVVRQPVVLPREGFSEVDNTPGKLYAILLGERHRGALGSAISAFGN